MSVPRALTRPYLILVVALAASLTATAILAGPADARQGAPHNRTDDIFSQKMRKHHLHGIAMAQLALAKSADPAVRDLAARIFAAQTAEARRMRGFLRASGAPLDGPPVPIIRLLENGQQLAELRARAGTEFDRAFLTYMQGHHFGGVDMAEIEVRAGLLRKARGLAARISATQVREAAEMEALLARY